MKVLQKGFTLIELMMVVAIIGILAAIALPTYKDYSIRSKMSEPILAVSKCRTSVTEASQFGLQSAPAANGFGCGEVGSASPYSSQYVAKIETTNTGVVSAEVQRIDTAVNGKKVILTPYTNDALSTAAVNSDFVTGTQKAVVGWRCTSDADAKYLPASCR